MIHVDLTGAAPFFGAHTPDYAAAEAAHRTLSEKTGAGSDFLGWTELPRRIRETELARILAAGKTIREKGDALVVVGIGGSYLGARAAYELIGRREGGAELLFAGNGLSAATLRDTIEKLGDRGFCVNVVSKSGTTLEPALGFRVFRSHLRHDRRAPRRSQERGGRRWVGELCRSRRRRRALQRALRRRPAAALRRGHRH